MKNIILLLSIFSFTSTTYAATISGTVTDSQSGKPISGASVVFRISISNDHLKISNEILDSLKNTYETKQLMYSPEWRRETEQEIARMERNLQVFQEEIDSAVDGIMGQLDDPAVQTEDGDLDKLGDYDLESSQEEEFRDAESQLQMELDSLKNKYEEIPTGMQYRNERWRMENKIATMERNLQVFQKETEALAREKAEALAREETRAKAVREIIRKAKVGKLDTLATAVTKSDGSFSFDVDYVLRAARYDVVVSAEGYEDGQNIIRFKTGKETLTSNIALGLQTELKLIDYGIVTANGDNIIKSGILTDIEVRIQNRGQGIAEDIRFKIRFVKGVYLGPDSKKSYNFKTLKAGEFKDLKFSFKPSKNVKNIIHIYIDYIEKSNSGTFTIQLEVGKPQKSIKEFVVEGSKLYFNDVEIPQWVDDVGQEYPTIDILTQYKKYME